MIEGIEKFYQIIGDSIFSEITEPWTDARADAIFYADSVTFEGEYTRKKDRLPRSLIYSEEGQNAFVELRRRFKDAGKPLWGQATFFVTANGNFKMEFGYDQCDADGNTIFDPEEYKRQSESRRQRLTQAPSSWIKRLAEAVKQKLPGSRAE